MPRKVSGSGSGELLNGGRDEIPVPAEQDTPAPAPDSLDGRPAPTPAGPAGPADSADEPRRTASGRVRHEDKITVYVSRDELMRLEQARLKLRGDHGVSADRGHIVRTAVAAALDDLAEQGADAELVRRLTDE